MPLHSRGISKSSVGIETVNCEETSTEEISAIVKRSSGFCIGSPTLAGHMPTPVQVRTAAESTTYFLFFLVSVRVVSFSVTLFG